MEKLVSELLERGIVFVSHTYAPEFVRQARKRGINPNGGAMIGGGQYFYI